MSDQTPIEVAVHAVMQELRADAQRRADIAACHQFAWVSIERLTESLSTLTARCEALEQENAQLRAAQQADQERFDRDLQNYSSGYTQALDDALKGKP